MSSLWFNDCWWMSMMVNQWLRMATGMMLNHQQLPWRSFQNAQRKAWPWPTPENVALESSSSGTESGWAKQRRLGWLGVNRWERDPKHGMKAMNMGRKDTIPTGIFLVDYLARWYGHHKKNRQKCVLPEVKICVQPQWRWFSHPHPEDSKHPSSLAQLDQPSGLRGIKSPPSKSVMETLWSRHGLFSIIFP